MLGFMWTLLVHTRWRRHWYLWRWRKWGVRLFDTFIIKELSTTAADDILKILYFSEKIRFNISCESSAQQTIHMKCQALFYRKIILKKRKEKKEKKDTLSSATILLGILSYWAILELILYAACDQPVHIITAFSILKYIFQYPSIL